MSKSIILSYCFYFLTLPVQLYAMDAPNNKRVADNEIAPPAKRQCTSSISEQDPILKVNGDKVEIWNNDTIVDIFDLSSDDSEFLPSTYYGKELANYFNQGVLFTGRPIPSRNLQTFFRIKEDNLKSIKYFNDFLANIDFICPHTTSAYLHLGYLFEKENKYENALNSFILASNDGDEEAAAKVREISYRCMELWKKEFEIIQDKALWCSSTFDICTFLKEDILRVILNLLPVPDAINIRSVCKKFNNCSIREDNFYSSNHEPYSRFILIYPNLTELHVNDNFCFKRFKQGDILLLTNLQKLFIENYTTEFCPFYESDLALLTGLTELQLSCDVDVNALQLSRFTKLNSLSLFVPKITENTFCLLSSLTHLEILECNKVVLSNFPNLQKLSIGSELADVCPFERTDLALLTGLTDLKLAFPIDIDSMQLSRLTKLNSLSLSYPKITENTFDHLSTLTKLEILECRKVVLSNFTSLINLVTLKIQEYCEIGDDLGENID